MANVCLGCHEVEDVRTCPKKECGHYPYRNQHLSMDKVHNDKITSSVRRLAAEIARYTPVKEA